MTPVPVTRAQVVREARTWIGTRWTHQGRRKDSGTDCVGLVYGVCESLGLLDPAQLTLPPYERRTTDNEMIRLASLYLKRRNGPLIPGTVVAMRFDFSTRHMGLLGDYPDGGLSLIHAYATSRKVIEHRLDQAWRIRIAASFDLPGVIDA